MKWRDFIEARAYVQKLGLKSQKEWPKYAHSGNRPTDIPKTPHKVYKNMGWKGYGDWLGTGRVANVNKKFLPFLQARKYAQSQGLKSYSDWQKFSKSGKLPSNVPTSPAVQYAGKGWKNWGNWLGTGRIADQEKYKQFLDYEHAKKIVHKLKLRGESDWIVYINSGKLPRNIPSSPRSFYKNRGWKGMGDWLGTGRVANVNKKFLPFLQARKYAQSQGLKSYSDWQKFSKSGKLPSNIPANPSREYKDTGWKGMGDWLGTGTKAPRDMITIPFEQARIYARSLNHSGRDQWEKYCRSKRLRIGIPTHPDRAYHNEGWQGWGDWLGTGNEASQITGCSISKVKDLVRDMIKYNVLNDFTEDERHQIILHKGLIHLYSPQARFLRASLEGKLREDQLNKFVDSYGEDLPDIDTEPGQEYDEEIKTKSTDELDKLVDQEKEEDKDSLEDITPSYKEVLGDKRTKFIDTYCQDEELMQFFVRKSIEKIWKDIFWSADREPSIVDDISRNYDDEKSIFRRNTRKTFLEEYNAVKRMRIPKGYSFPEIPKRMQLYVAWKIRKEPCFLNLSGTGAGKTLSAVIASRVINSKMTLIICPNDVIRTWRETIKQTFLDSIIIAGLDAFNTQYDKSKHQYLVLNYDKFSQPYTQYYINKLIQTKIDFIVLDEIQFIKKRTDIEESQRRHNLAALFFEARERNPNIKALGMSATPVINHLSEGISLLSYITGYDFNDDLSDRSNVPNAMALHQKLSLVSIREMPHYRTKVREHFTEVYAPKPENIRMRFKELVKSPLQIEQYLTVARLPEIIKKIDNRQTIIYTEYVTEIIDMIKDAVKAEGYTYALYTGASHEEEDLDRFINKKVKVLISSKPVSVGLDGLQKNCNNLILNTLPWTHAGYKQLIGRLHRMGQNEDYVDVHIIKATMAGFEYDRFKWTRIEFKGDLADCAVDGRIPKGHLQSKEQLQLELIKWLERLERNEISIFERRRLNVPLSPAELATHERAISNFSKLNRVWNKSFSTTIHNDIKKDPRKLLDYHKHLDILKSRWVVDPVNVIVEKINSLKIPASLIMKLVIGDFGSGRCKLADLLKENKVYSFDHDKILDDRIIACNMKKTKLKDYSLDVAVFCLSLMHQDWREYIKEAKRTLTRNGYLIIAEVTRTLKKSDEDGEGEGRLYKLKDVLEEEGFRLEDEDTRDRFTFITAVSS